MDYAMATQRSPFAAPWHEPWSRPLPMEESPPVDTDAFLLNLDENEFVRVGAMLGLRARPAEPRDSVIVDRFLDSDFLFRSSDSPSLVTRMPNPRSH